MIRKLFRELRDLKFFTDNILAHTATWLQQINTLRALFESLQEACKTAKSPQCQFGFREVGFVCCSVRNGLLQPEVDKTWAIQESILSVDEEKNRFLGGFIRNFGKFVPDFAAIAPPRIDLTKKDKPNEVDWIQELGFSILKKVLLKPPVLHLQDF